MKKIIVKIIISAFLFLSLSAYNTAGVLPYMKDKNGNVIILIGKEHRRDCGGKALWCDFRGMKDRHEINSFVTAKREFEEESAWAVDLKPLSQRVSPIYSGRSTDIYILEVKSFVKGSDIKASAKRVNKRCVEKYEWEWVYAKDLLKKSKNPAYCLKSINGKVINQLYFNFEKVLNYKPVRRYLKSL